MALARKPKSVRIAIRIGVEESAMLNDLIEETGMLASDVIRQAIRGHYARKPIVVQLKPARRDTESVSIELTEPSSTKKSKPRRKTRKSK